MGDLRIIYTPDASKFCLQEHETLFPEGRYLNNPRSVSLREHYGTLRKAFPDLEDRVGVVTYSDIKKAASKIGSFEIEGGHSTFFPLDILEQAVELKSEDQNNPVAMEYAYRQLGYLFSHSCFGTKPGMTRYLAWLSLIPHGRQAVAKGKEIAKMFEDRMAADPSFLESLGEQRKLIPQLSDVMNRLAEVYDFRQIEAFHDRYRRDFESNKVSRTFPLTYIDSEFIVPDIGSVDLADKTSIPDFIKSLFEGENAIMRNAIEENRWFVDHFAATTYHQDLGAMIESLPDRKTLITDTYVVSLFPQLASRDFVAHEFLPERHQ